MAPARPQDQTMAKVSPENMLLSPKVSCWDKEQETWEPWFYFKWREMQFSIREVTACLCLVIGQVVRWKPAANSPHPRVFIQIFPDGLGSNNHFALAGLGLRPIPFPAEFYHFTIRFYIVRLVRNLCEQKGFSRQFFSDMGITKVRWEPGWPWGLHIWKGSHRIHYLCLLKRTRHSAWTNQVSVQLSHHAGWIKHWIS